MGNWIKNNLKVAAELVSALVVLVGLVFVGIELQQNTSAVEAATVQGLTDASNDFLLAIAADPELVRAWNTGLFDPDALDDQDSARFFLLARSYWLRMQNGFSQYERGTLSEEDWRVYERLICGASEGIDSGNGLKGGQAYMHIRYLEIVTSDVNAVCAAYASACGIRFSKPDPALGNARTAPLPGGGLLGVRAPLSDTEEPVVRPYWQVADIEAALAAVVEAGGQVALPPMELPGHGTCAIYLQGGNQHGLWQV